MSNNCEEKGGCAINEIMMQLWKNIKRQQKGDAINKEINTQVTYVFNKWLLASESLKHYNFKIYKKKNLRVTIFNTKKQSLSVIIFYQGPSINICLSSSSLKICLSGPIY